MTFRLNVVKVLYGAFMVPWWNWRKFGRALAIPLVSLVTLSLCWHFAREILPPLSHWLLYLVHGILFVLFAVTCHRLILLDTAPDGTQLTLQCSWREMRFFLWLIAISLLCFGLGYLLIMSTLTVALPLVGNSHETLFKGTANLAKVPALYLFARLCLVFPATAVDRKVHLKWTWQLTRGNGWRLFLVIAALPWFISQMLSLIYREDASVIETVLMTLLGCMLFTVEIAALSLSYRELTKMEGA